MKIIDRSNNLPWCKPHVDFLQSLWDSSIMVDVTFLCTKILRRILFEKMFVPLNYIKLFIKSVSVYDKKVMWVLNDVTTLAYHLGCMHLGTG